MNIHSQTGSEGKQTGKGIYFIKLGMITKKTNEPVREKTNNLCSDQVRHKSSCTVIEDG